MADGASKMQASAVVLLSGGLDSSVAMAVAQQQYHVALALTVYYGQRAFPNELVASRRMASHCNVSHQVIELPWLAALLPTGMRKDGVSHRAFTDDTAAFDAVWVPNRNGVLLNVAAAYAEALQASAVIFGANADEGASFPDNTEAYRAAVTDSLRYGTRRHVRVIAPLVDKTKAQILALADTLQLPHHQTWSCYEAGDTPCGVCLSCRVRAAGHAALDRAVTA